MITKEELCSVVASELDCLEEDLIWSDKCNNPRTSVHHEDGTIKCRQGYWVRK